MNEFDASVMLEEIKLIRLELAFVQRCYPDDEQAALQALKWLWRIQS